MLSTVCGRASRVGTYHISGTPTSTRFSVRSQRTGDLLYACADNTNYMSTHPVRPLSEQFLALYNQAGHHLNRLTRSDERTSFADKLTPAVKTNSVIADNLFTLMDFGRLRNFIWHTRGDVRRKLCVTRDGVMQITVLVQFLICVGLAAWLILYVVFELGAGRCRARSGARRHMAAMAGLGLDQTRAQCPPPLQSRSNANVRFVAGSSSGRQSHSALPGQYCAKKRLSLASATRSGGKLEPR
jgi:hypothetical protein